MVAPASRFAVEQEGATHERGSRTKCAGLRLRDMRKVQSDRDPGASSSFRVWFSNSIHVAKEADATGHPNGYALETW
jgi:hypothetical protein